MQLGIDSFAAVHKDPLDGSVLSPADRLELLLNEIQTADEVGLDVFGVGEHHREEFLDSAPAIILAAAAARTSRIKLTSAVTVLSAADPVRVFQEFATLDLISKGRAELVVGRGSFGEAFPLFGLQAEDYDDLFTEKLDLLLNLQKGVNVHWNGRHRPALTGQGVYPRPFQKQIPVWLGVGGTPQSFIRAGLLGLPLMVAIIGGEFRRFRPLVDLYRDAYRESGHPSEGMRVGVHAFGFVGETDDAARDTFFPGWFQMFTQIGRERGWPPPSRAQFDALCGETGAYLIGDPTTVAAKVLAASKALGGIQRLTFQKSSALVRFPQMQDSIRLLGNEVAPLVRANSGQVA